MDGDTHRATLAVGIHWLVDCHGVDAAKLASADFLRRTLREAAEAAGATILFDHFHDFGGAVDGKAGGAAGVTGVVLLAESHISIHTWPEFEFAAIDIFMCGLPAPERALAVLVEALAPSRQHIKTAARGISPTPIANAL